MKNTNESGRSMVEMLGVLAIIGVLSIGGIAGYTMAMDKYQANEIVNSLVKAAIHCRTLTATPEAPNDDIKTYGDADADLISKVECKNINTGLIEFTFNTVNANVQKNVCKALGIADTNGACPNTKQYLPQS